MGRKTQRKTIADLKDLRTKFEEQLEVLNAEIEKTRSGKSEYKVEHLEKQKKDVKRKLKVISAMLKKSQTAMYLIHMDSKMLKPQATASGIQGGGTRKKIK